MIARCRELAEETEGYFDAEAVVPGTIDPSGLVKGWSVDRAAALLDEAGDAQLRGERRRRHPPSRRGAARSALARRHPAPADPRPASRPWSRADDLAVATSGEYARGEHIVDPHTGRPPQGLLSVTITGPDLATADAYATAAFAMGEDGPEWTRRLAAVRGDDDHRDGRVLSTPGFPRARDARRAGRRLSATRSRARRAASRAR